jgi:S-methylmethionine-dependent homocysteine/selenocysteine methylase
LIDKTSSIYLYVKLKVLASWIFSSIKSFEFSTLYTTLPHDKLKTRLKETIHKAFSHRNDGSKFVVLGYNCTYFSVIYATTRVNSFTIFLLSLFYYRQNLCQVNRQFFRRTSWWSRYVPFFVWCLMEFRYPI